MPGCLSLVTDTTPRVIGTLTRVHGVCVCEAAVFFCLFVYPIFVAPS